MGGEVPAHLIEAEQLILEAPCLAGPDRRHVTRHKVVAALDLNAVAGEEYRDLVARCELVQELLPGLVEGRPPDIFSLDDIEAHRFERSFHCSCIVHGLGQLPLARQVVVLVDADHERDALGVRR